MLVFAVIGWICGLVLSSWGHHVEVIWPWLVGSGLILFLLLRRDHFVRTMAIMLVAAGFGTFRYAIAQPQFTDQDLASYNDHGYLEMTGIVVDQPDVRDNTTHLRFEVQSVYSKKNGTKPIHGLALIDADRLGKYAYGDQLRIYGALWTPPEFDTFSYSGFLGRSGIYTLVLNPKITVLQHGQGNGLLMGLFDLKARASTLIDTLLSSPNSAILKAVLLGDRRDVAPEILDALNITGTTHMITVSGSNIAILVGLLMLVGTRLINKRAAAVITVIMVVIYVILTGAGLSAIRAAIISTLAILAQRLGRKNDGPTALAIAIFLITAVSPNSLFDLSLIIGSAATLGILLYMPPMMEFTDASLKRLFPSMTLRRFIGIIVDALIMTIAAQITTLPIIALVFKQFSASSFLVNTLIGPVQALIMLFGILTLVLGVIAVPVGQIGAWLVNLPISYSLGIIRSVAQWPNASSTISVSLGMVIGFYVILALLTFGLPELRRRYQAQPIESRRSVLPKWGRAMVVPALGILGLAVGVMVWVAALQRPDGLLHVWFLAVGSGNAVLIQTPSGADMLIDGGENPTQLQSALGEHIPAFKHDLDTLFITEIKRGTVTALPGVFERYNVRSVISNGQFFNDLTSRVIDNSLRRDNVTAQTATAGYRVTTNDGVTFEVISPAGVPQLTDNADEYSLVMRLRYGDASFLLTSKLSEKGVKKVMDAHPDLGATVLELPSNGTEKPNSDDFLKAVSPQIAVIRAETGSQTAQPADSVLQKLNDMNVPVYRTDQLGTIEIATDGKQLMIQTSKAGQ